MKQNSQLSDPLSPSCESQLSSSYYTLGILNELPGDRAAVVGRHPVALSDGRSRSRRADDLPHPTLRTRVASASRRTDWRPLQRILKHFLSP